MSVIVRTVPSTPIRTSVQTWETIVGLLTEAGQEAQAKLTAVTGVAATLIAEEYTSLAPIVVKPARGERVRIYTAHGALALEGEEPPPLATWPLVEAGWSLSLPCAAEDIDEMRDLLEKHPEIEVRDLADGITAAAAPACASAPGTFTINYDELERP
ncbi:MULTISPECIES: hypothetical protein [unclassified Amycolatopsis]|uniref:hypothetical protein n=1 Tax=unclassified Amycolatopsis TaxID=2618356 RepID=UPI0028741D9B|nr:MULTISPECIES: hypothetical protein [unclassified Amycolatopsis]MDS0133207.1 hypothetical protein [Amycolatopsis sp. 505]MDS0146437.1 hypothetical protein [Amycolatopsis sp. CM201R]